MKVAPLLPSEVQELFLLADCLGSLYLNGSKHSFNQLVLVQRNVCDFHARAIFLCSHKALVFVNFQATYNLPISKLGFFISFELLKNSDYLFLNSCDYEFDCLMQVLSQFCYFKLKLFKLSLMRGRRRSSRRRRIHNLIKINLEFS